jgi:hypothetical protein
MTQKQRQPRTISLYASRRVSLKLSTVDCREGLPPPPLPPIDACLLAVWSGQQGLAQWRLVNFTKHVTAQNSFSNDEIIFNKAATGLRKPKGHTKVNV